MSKKKSSKKKKRFVLFKKLGKIISNFFKAIYKFFDKIIITPISKILYSISKILKTNNKPLERLLNNKSFLIILSLVLALGTYTLVDIRTDNVMDNSAEILYGKQVTALYNEEAYVVEGLPETVDITMIGRRADLYLAKQYPNDEVVVDLRDLKPGTHKVSLKYIGSVTSVEYKLDPSSAAIVIHEKISESKTISTEILNQEELDSKFIISKMAFSREEAYIKGAKYKLDEVAIVKALVDINNITNPTVGTTTLKEIPLIAYNNKGEKLDVEIVPATIDATVEIKSPSKTVPLKVEPQGEVTFGKAINNISLSATSTVIYGEEKVLENITYIPVKIDVTDLNENTEFDINISKPSGVKDMSIKTVVAKVTLETISEKTITGVSIETRNLKEGYIAQAASQQDSSVDVIVKGTSKNINAINKENIKAYVDLQGLEEGKHTIEVKVTGEDLKLSYTPKTSKVTIIIRKQ